MGGNMRLGLGEIVASLAVNTTLRHLMVVNIQGVVDQFDNLMCDSSTVEHICNSNHTIEAIYVLDDPPDISAHTIECLKLNMNENKNKVVQNKIMQYYFAGRFDLAPFVSMPVSVIAAVMSCGEGMNNKQTAIFELLRGIPQLCNVSSRMVKIAFNKRQKVSAL
jgi:hypothetical protein